MIAVMTGTETMTPQAFRAQVHLFQPSRVLLTACELDVFTAIGDGPRTSAEVAAAIGADPRATDRLLNALVAMGFLGKRAGRFANGAFAARYLVRGRPEYLAGLRHSVQLWTTWSTLTEAVRAGRCVVSRPTGADAAAAREAFIAAMHWRGATQAAEVADLVDLAGVRRVLDVGGGSGVFSMAFVRAQPGLQATVFDLPEVVPLTERYLAEAGLADRVAVVAGDLTRDELGRDFDLVFISAVIHSFPPDENRRLLEKAAAALVPGGRVVVQDFLMDEARTGPLQAALFALNMLVSTPAGDTYTESEVRAWMGAAGFEAIARRDTSFGTSLLVGRLPPRRQSAGAPA
jgi:SAM-dependent methyltransferase